MKVSNASTTEPQVYYPNLLCCGAGILYNGRSLILSLIESFDLFARTDSSLSLGHLSASSQSSRSSNAPLSISISSLSKDLTITQSSTLLYSSLPGGTTGAVVWRLQPLLAAWLLSPTNPLFRTSATGSGPIVDSQATVLELGTGIGGVLALALALSRRVARVIATDQPYVLRGLRANLAANLPGPDVAGDAASSSKGSAKRKAASDKRPASSSIDVLALDWETSDAASLAAQASLPAGPDLVLACDCVYNEALVAPLVRTCAEICTIRPRWKVEADGDGMNANAGDLTLANPDELRPTVCVVAQQLRAPEVFEAWLQAFLERFRVWRVHRDSIGPGLRVEDGFVVHVGVLRNDIKH